MRLQPQVVITLVAAGSIDDYDETRRTSLRAGFAANMGVGIDAVALTIAPASVAMRFEVDVATEEATRPRVPQHAIAG